MSTIQILITLILIASLGAQAAIPNFRLLIVTTGAAFAALVSTLFGTAPLPLIFSNIPWDVLILVVGLGLLSELFATSHFFGLLALRATRLSQANPMRVTLLFAGGMYVVSGLVNNLTALLLVLPVLLNLFKLLGATQRYTTWTLGLLLVACNLGGAATPIGDFPAILLLGRGAMDFSNYLVHAAPQTLVALVLLVLVVTFIVRPARDLEREPIQSKLALAIMGALYRGVKVQKQSFVPSSGALFAMLIGWTIIPRSTGIGPELICWLGTGLALLLVPKTGERLARTRVDIEAVLFLLSLFVMVGAVRQSGMFQSAARILMGLPISPTLQIFFFLTAAAVLTGLFSAGPSMAALLDVAFELAKQHPPTTVYVGLAMSVCAGSSLFLTAATSGPLAQALTERAGLRESSGFAVRFGFFEFLPVGILSFCIILGVGLSFAWLGLHSPN